MAHPVSQSMEVPPPPPPPPPPSLYEGGKLIAFHMSLQCLITQGK